MKRRLYKKDLFKSIAPLFGVSRDALWRYNSAWETAISDLLLDGEEVPVGNLGTFYTSISCKGNRVLRFRPNRKFNQRLRGRTVHALLAVKEDDLA